MFTLLRTLQFWFYLGFCLFLFLLLTEYVINYYKTCSEVELIYELNKPKAVKPIRNKNIICIEDYFHSIDSIFLKLAKQGILGILSSNMLPGIEEIYFCIEFVEFCHQVNLQLPKFGI